ncbi:MAG: hypothetical protein K2H15_01295, partial [Muribaculaceae bacterium]|nr:hypothetical protein [Muribaculaceae bacterium]
MMTISGCSKKRETESDEALRQVLRVQRLQNLYPDADNVPEMEAIVDSMGREGKSPYYFAALNVMTDRLFSDGRFAEADSMAVRMRNEAIEIGD